MNIKELCERYGLKTRQSIYERINQLGINLSKEGNKSYATLEQITLLDQLNDYMVSGGTLKTFTPTIATTTEIDTVSVEVDSYLDTVSHNLDTSLEPAQINDLVSLVQAIASVTNKPDALAHHRQLEEATARGWILSTNEIEELLGVKPRGETFTRGCWVFSRAGSIGRGAAWKVSKN
jgi:hypothetical protein